jgi:hypothetical protein
VTEIPDVGEDLAVDGLKLVSARLEDLGDDVWPLPWQRQFVAVLVALDEAVHQVPDIDCSALDPMAMVSA